MELSSMPETWRSRQAVLVYLSHALTGCCFAPHCDDSYISGDNGDAACSSRGIFVKPS